MFKGSLVIVLILFPLFLVGQIREDHVLHFGAGMVAGGAGAFAASEISGGSRGWTFAGAVAGGLIAGIAKEAIDAGKEDNRWDNTDLAATALGGVTIGITIDLFTANARKRRKRVQLPAHNTLSLQQLPESGSFQKATLTSSLVLPLESR